MKRIISLLLCLLLLSSMTLSAWAAPNQSRAVIGADLNDTQIALVYQQFGLRRGETIELRLTNAEERRYLEGFVDDRMIGTRSISCVYVELLSGGSGISVTTSNVTWCTGQMYASALATAGITDARILVAAPFEVSGTAALAGIYKAYEDMTGIKLDDVAKLVGTQELTITGELAEQIGSMDSTSIVSELKLMLEETRRMSDEQIRETINAIAARYNVRLTEAQVQQLISLCRSMERLNPEELKERVEEMQGTLQRISEAKTKVVGFAQSVREFMDSVSEFFEKLQRFMDKFS